MFAAGERGSGLASERGVRLGIWGLAMNAFQQFVRDVSRRNGNFDEVVSAGRKRRHSNGVPLRLSVRPVNWPQS